jgi:hypothetical protein
VTAPERFAWRNAGRHGNRLRPLPVPKGPFGLRDEYESVQRDARFSYASKRASVVLAAPDAFEDRVDPSPRVGTVRRGVERLPAGRCPGDEQVEVDVA